MALIGGTVAVTLLYMALNVVFLHALPPEAMSGTVNIGTKAANALFGAAAGRWVGCAIAVGLLSVLSAMIMTRPRVYFAMAMVLTATFDQLLIYIGFTLSLSALMTVAGLEVLRRRRPEVQTAYRTLGYPATPLLFIMGNAWIIYYAIKSRPIASLTGLATIATGLMAYMVFHHKSE